MKTCVSCKTAKPATSEHFYYRNKARGWLSSWCKICRGVRRESTKVAENATQQKRRELKVKLCVSCGTTESPKGKMYCAPCKTTKRRAEKKFDKAIYKGRLRKAMPAWADKDKIREIYANRPEGMHVDHVIPLRGKLVCGLHVETNLAYLEGEENARKSNSFKDGNHFSLEHNGIK